MMDLTSNDLRNYLRDSVMEIIFIKKDGSERTMRCTLCEDFFEPYAPKTNTKPRSISTSAVSVFDLDLKQWRSVIPENILTYRFLPNYEKEI